jgi:hypothetical protein
MKSPSLLLLTILLLSAGCSSVRTSTPEGQAVTMSEAEFSAYVEKVFRHHNKVYNELISAAGIEETDSVDGHPNQLLTAEEDMIHVCLPLNEVVATTVEGGKPSMNSKWKLLSAVPACEAATRKVEALMPEEITHK